MKKCSRCGKEAELKDGLCSECYKRVKRKKFAHSKSKTDPNFVKNQLEPDEKIIAKLKSSNIIFSAIVYAYAISVILFPKTIIEFFVLNNTYYFPVLIANILICAIGIYTTIYFASREVCLTNKRILAKWGIFNVQTLNAPLNQIESIDTFKLKALEINIYNHIYVFDFTSNAEEFKLATANQVSKIIEATDDDHVLMSFSRSIHGKLEEYKLNQEHPDMIYCKCCGGVISKESKFCVHCGQPLPENERDADWILKIFCFCIPPLGLLLFLINVGERPKLANKCLISSVLSLIIILTIYLSAASILSIL